VVATLVAARSGGLRSAAVTTDSDRWEHLLIQRIIAGDDSALAAVYDQYSPLVFGVAVNLVGAGYAGDVCQEVFLSLWNHPERFDPSRGNLRSFLITIARRRSIDLLRAQGRREANEERAGRHEPISAPHVDEAAIALVAGQKVREALAVLPDPQREAIELAYFRGLTFREVAAATNTSEGTAKSRIRLGLQRLATELRAHKEVRLI
jgi:RNA polymerase sigma-70 factor, ECF subfamily